MHEWDPNMLIETVWQPFY